jgi:hypothetical protein
VSDFCLSPLHPKTETDSVTETLRVLTVWEDRHYPKYQSRLFERMLLSWLCVICKAFVRKILGNHARWNYNTFHYWEKMWFW